MEELLPKRHVAKINGNNLNNTIAPASVAFAKTHQDQIHRTSYILEIHKVRTIYFYCAVSVEEQRFSCMKWRRSNCNLVSSDVHFSRVLMDRDKITISQSLQGACHQGFVNTVLLTSFFYYYLFHWWVVEQQQKYRIHFR